MQVSMPVVLEYGHENSLSSFEQYVSEFIGITSHGNYAIFIQKINERIEAYM